MILTGPYWPDVRISVSGKLREDPNRMLGSSLGPLSVWHQHYSVVSCFLSESCDRHAAPHPAIPVSRRKETMRSDSAPSS